GFDSSGKRDAKVRELVKKYLSKGRSGDYLDVAMVPVPGRKGATVRVASADPVAVTPMPYPAFRMVGQSAPPAAIAVASAPDPVDVARQLQDPVIVSSIDDLPVPADRPMDIGLQPA